MLRAGINLKKLNYEQPTQDIHVPTLLFHDTTDAMIPVASSNTFVQSHPNLVTYQRVEHTDHTQAWNVDSHAYEDALKTLLMQISEPEANTTNKPFERTQS